MLAVKCLTLRTGLAPLCVRRGDLPDWQRCPVSADVPPIWDALQRTMRLSLHLAPWPGEHRVLSSEEVLLLTGSLQLTSASAQDAAVPLDEAAVVRPADAPLDAALVTELARSGARCVLLQAAEQLTTGPCAAGSLAPVQPAIVGAVLAQDCAAALAATQRPDGTRQPPQLGTSLSELTRCTLLRVDATTSLDAVLSLFRQVGWGLWRKASQPPSGWQRPCMSGGLSSADS